MSPTSGLRGIPWAFIEHELLTTWIWRTDHFEARVTSDINSFSWVILDRVADSEGLFLTEGRARDFNEAERGVREAIGKSYPPRYGYGAYAGALATTFTIATREQVDFAEFAGRRAVVTVRFPGGEDRSYVGEIRVVHHEIHLTPDSGQTIRIQPSHIAKIVGEGGGTASSRSAYTGMGRVYRGPSVPRGCNGRPGFLPDTIDHTGIPCSVHEDARLRY